ncbi:MAG: DUF1080 domain-containing protein [Pirellula sp.]|nr:DUF1080 domain-containing protein [Pirellula sp.]
MQTFIEHNQIEIDSNNRERSHFILRALGLKLSSFLLVLMTLMVTTTNRASAVDGEEAKLQPGFIWLFDGKTLDGWEGNLEYFRVEDGAIVAGNLKSDIPHNEFLCTKKTYSDFELRFEAKLRGVGDNAGVQFRTKRLPNTTEVSGYQCDVGTAWNRSVWGCLYDESRRNKMLADAPAEKSMAWTKKGEWNELRIVANGDKIELYLNGNLSVDYTEKDSEIERSGIIGLQIHSGPPTEALYRNIQIKELNSKK